VKSLLDSRHPSTVAQVPDTIHGSTNDALTVEDQVERRELGGIRVRCLTNWLTILAAENQGLATDLSQWSQLSESADRDLPARRCCWRCSAMPPDREHHERCGALLIMRRATGARQHGHGVFAMQTHSHRDVGPQRIAGRP
jgi:hypothetical protein